MIITCPKCGSEIDKRNAIVVRNGLKSNIKTHCSKCGLDFTKVINQKEAEEIQKSNS